MNKKDATTKNSAKVSDIPLKPIQESEESVCQCETTKKELEEMKQKWIRQWQTTRISRNEWRKKNKNGSNLPMSAYY